MRLNLSNREVTGALVAPISIIVIFTAYILFLVGITGIGFTALFKLVLFTIVFAYAGMFLIGLPIVLALKKSDDLTLIRLIIFGGFAGLFVYPFALFVVTNGDIGPERANMVFGFFQGMIVALTYGIIAKVKIRGTAS